MTHVLTFCTINLGLFIVMVLTELHDPVNFSDAEAECALSFGLEMHYTMINQREWSSVGTFAVGFFFATSAQQFTHCWMYSRTPYISLTRNTVWYSFVRGLGPSKTMSGKPDQEFCTKH